METLQVNRRITCTTLFAATVLSALLAPCQHTAQEPASLPETKAPVPAQAAPAAAPAPAAEKHYDYDAKLDWPWLGRFKEADLALGPPAAGENRVVFMGDSITQGWKLDGPDGAKEVNQAVQDVVGYSPNIPL